MVEAPGRERRSPIEEMHARVYLSYQNALETRYMMDISDILLKTVKIFDQHPDILKVEAGRNRHLMVDEFPYCNLTQEIGRAHVGTPVTHAHLVCRPLLEQLNHIYNAGLDC